MCVHGQPLPCRLEGEQALPPRTEQQGVVVWVLALGEADGQSIDGPELWLDAVEPSAHEISIGAARRATSRRLCPVSVARRCVRIRRWTVRVVSRRAGPGPAGCAKGRPGS